MFFGVTVPCILSIFSVILFLRMGYILGQVRGGEEVSVGSAVLCIWVWVSEVRHCGEGVQIGVVQSIHCECSLCESDCAVYRTFTVPSPLNMHTWHSITGIYSVYKKFIKWCVYVCVCVC